jgi:hypothetical protein
MSDPAPAAAFGSLSPAEQEAVRESQRRRKLEKQQAREANRRKKEHAQAQAAATGGSGAAGQAGEDPLAAVAAYPDQISMDSYFGACPGGLFRDPGLPPSESSLELLMAVLQVCVSACARREGGTG